MSNTPFIPGPPLSPPGVSPGFSMWLNFAVALLAAIAGGAIPLANVLPKGPADTIVAWAGLLVAIVSVFNGVLHGVSQPKEGPILKSLRG